MNEILQALLAIFVIAVIAIGAALAGRDLIYGYVEWNGRLWLFGNKERALEAAREDGCFDE